MRGGLTTMGKLHHVIIRPFAFIGARPSQPYSDYADQYLSATAGSGEPRQDLENAGALPHSLEV